MGTMENNPSDGRFELAIDGRAEIAAAFCSRHPDYADIVAGANEKGRTA